MRIDPSGISGAANNLYGVGDNGKTSGASQRGAETSSTDQAQFGTQTDLVNLALNSASTDRVAQLRQMVQSGAYAVDTQALSRSIVDGTLNGY
jgi:anti-sigma28 factor (negative regulator of flagellin synthesis)